MNSVCFYACFENATFLGSLSIRAEYLPISYGTGSRLGVYFPTLFILDKIVAGVFNLESPAAIPTDLFKEVGWNTKRFIGWYVPASCAD